MRRHPRAMPFSDRTAGRVAALCLAHRSARDFGDVARGEFGVGKDRRLDGIEDVMCRLGKVHGFELWRLRPVAAREGGGGNRTAFRPPSEAGPACR